MNIVMVTFAFGQLLVQVLMGAWAEPYPIEVAFPIPDVRLTKCWPLDMNDDLVWPPSTDIPAADFGLIPRPRTRIGACQRNALLRVR